MIFREVAPGHIFKVVDADLLVDALFIKLGKGSHSLAHANVVNASSWIAAHVDDNAEVVVIGTVDAAKTKTKKEPNVEPKFPIIDFDYQCRVQDATIKEAIDLKTCRKISCEGMDVETLLANLRSGKWGLPFEEVYDEAGSIEDCELSNYDESSDNEDYGTGEPDEKDGD